MNNVIHWRDNYVNHLLFSGLLITGGWSTDGDAQHSAEVWLPGDRSCSLPRLPSPGRVAHTQSSLTACGGQGTAGTSYLTFSGEWEQSHSLSEVRWGHVSWQGPAGILLMGGTSSGTTTELLSTTNDTTTASFNLPYDTSSGCAIELQDRVVVTGGDDVNSGYPLSTVQVYTLSGAQERLPSLQTPRYWHACAHYLDNQNRVVSIACNITAHLTMVTMHCVVMINNNNNHYNKLCRFCW